jgi:hypothetical protein
MMVNAKKLGKGAAAEQDMFSNPLSSDTFEVEGGAAGRAVDAPAEPAPEGGGIGMATAPSGRTSLATAVVDHRTVVQELRPGQKWRHAINSISQMSQVNVGPHASRRSLFCFFLSS